MRAATRSIVHVTFSCDYCHFTNDITMTDIKDDQSLTCSRCGGHLGKVGQLVIADTHAPEQRAG